MRSWYMVMVHGPSAQERAEDEVEEAQAGGGSLFFLGHVTNGSLIINSHCASAL